MKPFYSTIDTLGQMLEWLGQFDPATPIEDSIVRNLSIDCATTPAQIKNAPIKIIVEPAR